MSDIKFRIAAKTDVGLVRTNNEDNFQAANDLSAGQMRWTNNEVCTLGLKGALLVVADGMGGMNAGEVASEIAINTVREWFSAENITDEVVKNRFTIERYMSDAIIAADKRIKEAAKEHPETRGMGTTIVVGWLFDGKLYVSWCGDSRAYVYNSVQGLHQITKDHSFVQQLVDRGSISREDAFDYPDSNIITRCLSDGGSKANPESLLKPYDVCDGDIILLCTDGLSGMIRDAETEAVIRSNEHDMDALADRLIEAACNASGADNVTVCLCQILQGGKATTPDYFIETEKRLGGIHSGTAGTLLTEATSGGSWMRKAMWLLLLLLVIASTVIGYKWNEDREKQKERQQQIDDSIRLAKQHELEKKRIEDSICAARKDSARVADSIKQASQRSVYGPAQPVLRIPIVYGGADKDKGTGAGKQGANQGHGGGNASGIAPTEGDNASELTPIKPSKPQEDRNNDNNRQSTGK